MAVAYYFLISTALLLLDQVTKHLISEKFSLCVMRPCDTLEILPVFMLRVHHNRGAAFSFLDDAGGWQRWFLVTVSTGVSVFIAVWLARLTRQQQLLALALAFILGGALGNLVDRAFQGYVVDFLVLHYDSHYFPAFNVADSAIAVGAALLILDMIINGDGTKSATTGSD